MLIKLVYTTKNIFLILIKNESLKNVDIHMSTFLLSSKVIPLFTPITNNIIIVEYVSYRSGV